jgi:hypothetical protein
MEKTHKKCILKTSAILFPIIVLLFTFRISSSPFWFSYLEIGKVVGPIFGLIVICILLIGTPLILFSIFYPESSASIIRSKLRTRKVQKKVVTSLIICFLSVILIQFGFLFQVSHTKIECFVHQNEGLDVETFVNNIPEFLNKNLINAYKKPESLYKIDLEVWNSIIDYQLMKAMGITRADLIMYQGWETCGQTAIVIEQILYEFGYESRRARFKIRDHEWAEVKNKDGKWKIADPTYMTKNRDLMDIEDLAKDTRFSDTIGVIVEYRNGTVVDMSQQHGYK